MPWVALCAALFSIFLCVLSGDLVGLSVSDEKSALSYAQAASAQIDECPQAFPAALDNTELERNEELSGDDILEQWSHTEAGYLGSNEGEAHYARATDKGVAERVFSSTSLSRGGGSPIGQPTLTRQRSRSSSRFFSCLVFITSHPRYP